MKFVQHLHFVPRIVKAKCAKCGAIEEYDYDPTNNLTKKCSCGSVAYVLIDYAPHRRGRERDAVDFWKADAVQITAELIKMYRKTYWGMIFSRTASLQSRWIAVQSLWIMRKMKAPAEAGRES